MLCCLTVSFWIPTICWKSLAHIVLGIGQSSLERGIYELANESASFVSLHGLSFLRCFTATSTTFSHNLAVLCVMMRFMFHLAFLHLKLQGFGTSAKPKNSGLCNQTLSPGGWGLGTRLRNAGRRALYISSCEHDVRMRCFTCCSIISTFNTLDHWRSSPAS